MGGTLWDKGDGRGLDDAVEAFTVADDHLIDRHILGDDCWASIAHAAGLHGAGVLSADELERLQRALLDIIERHEHDGITIERSQEDCHTAIEQLLTEQLGDLGKKIHTGRSRNDQVLTALRLFTRRRILAVAEALQRLAVRLLDRAENGTRTPVRTSASRPRRRRSSARRER